MKKIVKSISLVLGASFICSAAINASAHPIMVINNSNLPISIGYSMCDDNKQSCTFVKAHKLDAAQTGNNLFVVLGELKEKLEGLTINSAIITDKDGNKVASLAHSCDLPAGVNTVILNNYGSTRVVCQFGQG